MKIGICEAKNKDGNRCKYKAKYVQNKTGKKLCGHHAGSVIVTFK
jgi:hypothetical protein